MHYSRFINFNSLIRQKKYIYTNDSYSFLYAYIMSSYFDKMRKNHNNVQIILRWKIFIFKFHLNIIYWAKKKIVKLHGEHLIQG